MKNMTDREVKLMIARALLSHYELNGALSEDCEALGVEICYTLEVAVQVAFLNEVEKARPGGMVQFLRDTVETYEAIVHDLAALTTPYMTQPIKDSDQLIAAAEAIANHPDYRYQ